MKHLLYGTDIAGIRIPGTMEQEWTCLFEDYDNDVGWIG